jgi:hypothetical protein
LSTDLLKTEPVRPGYISPEVELVSMDAIHRVCAMCADLAD